MCFVTGKYSRGLPLGGMIGYVMDGDLLRAHRNVQRAIQRERKALRISPGGDFQPTPLLPDSTWHGETRHLDARMASSRYFIFCCRSNGDWPIRIDRPVPVVAVWDRAERKGTSIFHHDDRADAADSVDEPQTLQRFWRAVRRKPTGVCSLRALHLKSADFTEGDIANSSRKCRACGKPAGLRRSLASRYQLRGQSNGLMRRLRYQASDGRLA